MYNNKMVATEIHIAFGLMATITGPLLIGMWNSIQR